MQSTRNEAALQESEFVRMLVRSRIISEGQLKAVYDYQRSVGGSVVDILAKLNMVPRSDLETMLHAAMRGDDVATAVSGGRTSVAIDATKLALDGLKLHHRLIDKIPLEVVQRYLLTVFFPGASLDSRKLIVGHGRELPEAMAERIRSLLGVDLYTLHLNQAIAADFVVRYLERARKPVPEEILSLLGTQRREERAAASAAVAPREDSGSEIAIEVHAEPGSDAGEGRGEDEPSSRQATEPGSSDDTRGDTHDYDVDPARNNRTTQNSTRGVTRMMNEPSKDSDSKFGVDPSIEWTALLNLLVKKGFLTRDEVRVEIELLKRNKTQL